MAPYDEWNRVDDEEDEELQDTSYFDGKRDVILFAIDCSPSMLELRDDPVYEDVKTCHLLAALEAAMQIQKKKVVVGPNDSVGIMLFNTIRKNERKGQGADIKKGNFVYQPISTINAPKIQELIQLIDASREDPEYLRNEFPPMEDGRVPMGDVFTSCNWVLRDGAPKTASKRVFLITDEDDPHPGGRAERLKLSAQTTLTDLTQAGVNVEPFFIRTDERPFDATRFYSSVLMPSAVGETDPDEPGALPESLSITRIDDLLAQMRFHEVPKRAVFSVPLQLADGFVIGVKGYGLVTEQKKGAYKYFVDLGDRMEVAQSKTIYVDAHREAEVDKTQILFGMELGAGAAPERDQGLDDADGEGRGVASGATTRVVGKGRRVFYSAEEVRTFRTLGLEPGMKLLGFKDRSELAFEDNVKHSVFIYPDEMTYAGSRRTFAALLESLLKKNKIGLCLALTRRNASPVFCAMVPQAEKVEEGGWNEPPGIHLIQLPFADDIRAAPIEEAFRATKTIKDAALQWIQKLCVKKGGYPPDAYPNPTLAYHNAQLEASAFREEWDPAEFEDLTLPNVDKLHQRAGELMKAWKRELAADERADVVVVAAKGAGVKRKADVSVDEAEIRAKYEDGTLSKLRVDQLKEFLKAKSLPVSGVKSVLTDRVAEWLEKHG